MSFLFMSQLSFLILLSRKWPWVAQPPLKSDSPPQNIMGYISSQRHFIHCFILAFVKFSFFFSEINKIVRILYVFVLTTSFSGIVDMGSADKTGY